MSRNKLLVTSIAVTAGAIVAAVLALTASPRSQVVVDETTHLQCVACGHQYRVPPASLPPDFTNPNLPDVNALDCPKCHAKASIYPDVQCVKCGAWTVMPWYKYPNSQPAGPRWEPTCDGCGARL
jgi:hypothetical protein